MNRINFLPPWVETNLQPAFYDVESGTCLQQTSRMYAKVNQLVRCFNDLSTEVQNYVEQFIDLRNYVDEYFDNLDVQDEINNKLDEMVENGTFDDMFNNIVFKLDLSRKTKENRRLIAHRGAQADAPENTIPAFRIAVEQGYWGLECDVTRTSDNHYVVFHDSTVDRMTDGSGNIYEMTLAEVQALTIDAGANISQYPNLTIPTFEEYLELCVKSNVVPVIELKQEALTVDDIQPILTLIRNYNLEDIAVVISFNTTLLEKLRELSPSIRIQVIYSSLTQSDIDYCYSKKFGVDGSRTAWTTALSNYAKGKNVETNAWTVGSLANYTADLNFKLDYYTVNAIYYCVDKNNPISVNGDCIQAYSDYDKYCIENKKLVRRVFQTQNLSAVFNNDYRENRAFYPVIFKTEGKCIVSYDFTDSKYNDYNITIRAFDIEGIQLSDLGWLNHANTSFSNLPSNTAFVVLYCGKISGSLINEYDEKCILEMIRTVSLCESFEEYQDHTNEDFPYTIRCRRFKGGEMEHEIYLPTISPEYTAWGSIYSYNLTLDIPFIHNYTASPTVLIDLATQTTQNAMLMAPKYNTSKITRVSLVRPNTSSDNASINLVVKGKW